MEFLLWFAGAGCAFYLQASIWESLLHEHVLDVGVERRSLFYRLRDKLPMLWFGHLDHSTLHHYQTYRACYTEQFSSPEEEERLKAVLARQYPSEIVAMRVRSRYGATFTWSGVPMYGLPALLSFLWLFAAPSVTAAWAIALANILFSTHFLMHSKWVHPYLHMRFDRAMASAPPVLRWFLRTPYGLAIRISHFVHHRAPACNFNLQYGADLLRGKWRAPTSAEWDEMAEIGLVLPEHRARFEGRRILLHPF
jgi:hypothetical protein